MIGFTLLAALFMLLMAIAIGSIVGWRSGPLAGMTAAFVVLMVAGLGYVGLVTLTSGM